jgi:hypothetical protein
MNQTKITVIDPAARETAFSVGDDNYRLRYDFTAIAAFEDGTGINPATHPIPPTMQNLMCLLYVGLHHHHPEVKIETVTGWFTPQTSGDLSELAWKAFHGTMPKPASDTSEASADPPSA